jgi:hypothetical protein
MNKTGTYAFRDGEFVLVSNRPPNVVRTFDVHCPTGGYWEHNLSPFPMHIDSREHKRKVLKKLGVSEKKDKLLGGGIEV